MYLCDFYPLQRCLQYPLVFLTGDGHLSQTQNGDCSDDDSFSESEDEDDEDADDENCSEYDSSCEE